ncbi:DUF2384 domain-containing protein [Sphingomonas sp. RP10(2022)]|uniref:DUF2384 domain-containing protein n=1 Tax=Sphingomonas liriopis TaxID=2949094 RepID=A0A9X2HQ72_9SPHN|nr:antitoxin Xre/MbcA/ParS toxin-binding domain-containing protein [Sphingomonas liriopis]MCP3735436.1 DUF2384 domain-containing protein [Sphingomonas liriopis]
MSGTTQPTATSGDDGAPAPVKRSRVFRPARVAMPRLEAARQARVTALAWDVLRNRERVMAFLNATEPQLDARPLDLAIASDAGLARVERLLADMSAAPKA